MLKRLQALQQWISPLFPQADCQLSALSGDASFRRYFRLQVGAERYVVMDAPPPVENCEPFVALARCVENHGIRAPHVFAKELRQGFLLLSDFGDTQLLSVLNDEQRADALYRQALDILWRWQRISDLSDHVISTFDHTLFHYEFSLFTDWFLKLHCQVSASPADLEKLQSQYQLLMDSAFSQPQVFVHRDYHSRNLMLCEDGALGVLDFQDAVWGPMTYDVVSLLRDCYIEWPLDCVTQWARYFHEKMLMQPSLKHISFSQFMRWLDWMGLQRHIKCLGIFSRLAYRDQKQHFLREIPRVHRYALQISERYSELNWLYQFLKSLQYESNVISGGSWRALATVDVKNA